VAQFAAAADRRMNLNMNTLTTLSLS